jgi:hypothetical protein
LNVEYGSVDCFFKDSKQWFANFTKESESKEKEDSESEDPMGLEIMVKLISDIV